MTKMECAWNKSDDGGMRELTWISLLDSSTSVFVADWRTHASHDPSFTWHFPILSLDSVVCSLYHTEVSSTFVAYYYYYSCLPRDQCKMVELLALCWGDFVEQSLRSQKCGRRLKAVSTVLI
jgi:hypothetical protein